MLEKPDISDGKIITRLQAEYGLPAAQISFLPLGADANTAVYRVSADDGKVYFLKLRKDDFDQTSVAVPLFLKRSGVQPIIDILPTTAQQPWASLDDFTMILHPYIEGKNGYEAPLTDQQWIDFGAAFKTIHSLQVPPDITSLIQRETYTPYWREMVKTFQAQVEVCDFAEPVSAQLAEFMKAKREEIRFVVEQAENLALALHTRELDFVLCHSDIHAGNVLISAGGAFYIVDWDNPILAPKERDLMYINGGVGQVWDGERIESLFYQGYGQPRIDQTALAYYRFERIVQDIAAFCQQLLGSDQGGEDRQQSLHYLMSNFLPGHEIDFARKTTHKMKLI
jgi:spectinomycin phosphotransferase